MAKKYEDMLKSELIEIAKKKKLTGISKMNKAQLIQYIKTGKKPEVDKPFNASFLTESNTNWFNKKLLAYNPDNQKPIVFLPCASARKTRCKYGKKKISQSTSHQFLSVITRDKRFTKIIISEPLTAIPYSIEDDMPDYNYPPKLLTKAEKQIFIDRLSQFLINLKKDNPKRKNIYYIGGQHHYKILTKANAKANYPFKIIAKIPSRGIRDYSTASKEFKPIIK